MASKTDFISTRTLKFHFSFSKIQLFENQNDRGRQTTTSHLLVPSPNGGNSQDGPGRSQDPRTLVPFPTWVA